MPFLPARNPPTCPGKPEHRSPETVPIVSVSAERIGGGIQFISIGIQFGPIPGVWIEPNWTLIHLKRFWIAAGLLVVVLVLLLWLRLLLSSISQSSD